LALARFVAVVVRLAAGAAPAARDLADGARLVVEARAPEVVEAAFRLAADARLGVEVRLAAEAAPVVDALFVVDARCVLDAPLVVDVVDARFAVVVRLRAELPVGRAARLRVAPGPVSGFCLSSRASCFANRARLCSK